MSESLPTRKTFTVGTAVWDPGAVLKRGDNYNEPVADWQTRAVQKVVVDALESLRLHDDTGDRSDEGYMTALCDVADALGVEFR